MVEISIHTFECQRCGHTWLPRYISLAKPKVCPKCKSPYWDSLKRICITCGNLGRNIHHVFPLTLWLYRKFNSESKLSLRKVTILLCSNCHQMIHKAINWLIDTYWHEWQSSPTFSFQDAIKEDLIILLDRIKNTSRDKFMLYAAEIQIERFRKYHALLLRLARHSYS